MKKNITAFVFAVAAVTFFAACGGKDKNAHPCQGCKKETTEETTTKTTKEHSDKEEYSI